MPLRLAFAGLKHDHVKTVLRLALQDPRVSVGGVADDDPANRVAFEQAFGLPVRYASHRELLESVEFDALVVCEAFAGRGAVVSDALAAGKHVFCDKPLCTRIAELERIAALAAAQRLEVAVDFSLRQYWFQAGLALLQGEIGTIMSCTFAGPHGLGYDWRPRWYYAPGQHGGILNDLSGHGLDFVHWITGRRFTRVLAATCACVGLPQEPAFETCGEAYLELDGGATAFGHVDYLVPRGHPTTWRCVIAGTAGDASVDETTGLCLRPAGAPAKLVPVSALRGHAQHPFQDFVRLLTDGTPPLRTTAEALHCSLAALVAQQAAARQETALPIPSRP
jgi:predicted dehydrogenase